MVSYSTSPLVDGDGGLLDFQGESFGEDVFRGEDHQVVSFDISLAEEEAAKQPQDMFVSAEQAFCIDSKVKQWHLGIMYSLVAKRTVMALPKTQHLGLREAS